MLFTGLSASVLCFLFAVAFRALGFVGGALLALAVSLATPIAVAGLALTVRQAQSTRA
jgi:hypothetical protein